MKICTLIPLYNEAATIEELVKAAAKYSNGCLVVDDGSIDGSAQLASQAGAKVLHHQQNLGKGVSLRDGFDYILKQDYDAVITLDGDGQHDPRDIPKFIAQASDSSVGIIVGNRMNNVGRMPPIRILTNKFMSFIISKLSGQKIIDSQCGYRLIKKSVLEKLRLSTARFEIESEMLIDASRNNFKIDSVPISSIYQKETSRINPVVDTLRFTRFVFRYFLSSCFSKKRS